MPTAVVDSATCRHTACCGSRPAVRGRGRRRRRPRAAARQLQAQLHASAFPPIIASEQSEFVDVAVLGDLHLKEDAMDPFHEARAHFQAAFADNPRAAHTLVQLGDLGTGKTSGSTQAFQRARSYLDSYRVPYSLVTGNHDLEGVEFDSDSDNLAAWGAAFEQSHCWARDVGPCVLFGLSTTRYRDNVLSHHEVHVDAAQLEWFEAALAELAPGKPAIVFTHAPPLGCGLKVLNELHIKNRCAWLNHSVNPHVFIASVKRHPRIKAWFSGHFHLSHNYADSVAAAFGCAFVQTGVIGQHCHRDGFRQSRLLRALPTHCQVLTVDHEDGGRVRLDAEFAWDSPDDPVAQTPDDEIVCDVSAGYVCARDACSVMWRENMRWFTISADTLLAWQDEMLIEYDMATFAPTGCVTLDTHGADVRLLDSEGTDVTANVPGNGTCVAEIHLIGNDGIVRETFERNKWGTFFQVFQPNKWQLKREQLANEAAEQETVMA